MQRRIRDHKAIQARVDNWRKLSPKEQLASLDLRLGKGQGAVKQRKKITQRLGGS